MQLFAFSLREGGYLVLGKAESVSPLPEYFVLENARLKVYRRHGERVLIPASRGMSLTEDMASMAPPRPRSRDLLPSRGVQREGRQTIAERADQVLLRLPVGVVLVAPDYDIQLINTAARQLLGIHGTAVGQDFVHVAREVPSPVLRDGIDRARNGEETTVVVELDRGGRGVARSLGLTFMSHRMEQDHEHLEAVIVVISDITEERNLGNELHASVEKAEEELRALRRQSASLEDANKELLRANQELTTANAELRSSNEELLVGSEEIQAATEEVETLNEELQATNEELETLNEELQATVEELNTTNDDLEARGIELEETLATLAEQRRVSERDRSRLAKLLLDREQGMLVVDTTAQVVLRNDAWRDHFEGSESGEFQYFPDGDPAAIETIMSQVLPVVARGDSFAIELQARGPRGGQRRYDLPAKACETIAAASAEELSRSLRDELRRRSLPALLSALCIRTPTVGIAQQIARHF